MASHARSSLLVCVCAAAFFAFSAGRVLVPVAKAPALSISPSEIDVGSVIVGQTVNRSFSVTNTGSATLVIRDVKSTCECTVPRLDRRGLLPGDSEPLTVALHPAIPGTRRHQILIQTNDPHRPTVLVTLIATGVQ